MKRIYSVLLIIFLIINGLESPKALAQNADGGVGNRWNFGFNLGGMWQEKNAVDKNKAGVAGGFTFGRHYLYETNSPFYLGLRFRYLAGGTKGQDFHRSYGLKNNLVLNGTQDPNVNYDSIPGYYIHNYKTIIGEMGLEMTLGLNKLRKKTGILLYIFGGIGVTSSQTKLNVKGALETQYDYSGIDTTSVSNAQNQLDFLQDLNYETNAEGNEGGKENYHLALTYGVGFGKMLGKHVALGMEYKITQPMFGDGRIDGKNWDNSANAMTGNPQYHYWGGFIKLFWGSGHTKTDNNTNHVVNNPPPPTGIPPQVTITEPGNNFSTPFDRITVRGMVTNVNYQSSIRVKVNGLTHTDFLWNSSTKGISINAVLQPGGNVIEVRATNQFGSDEETVTINFTPAVPLRQPPSVIITNPVGNPYNSNASMVNVNAQIQNIDMPSQIQLSFNNVLTSNFSYDPYSKVLSYTAILSQGTNTVYISATNESGTGSAGLTINYNPVMNTGAKPIITVLNPPSNPSNTSQSVANVSAQVLNVSGSSAISVKVNNVTIPFQFNNTNKSLQFQSPLMPGANSVVIQATNQYGSDTKAITINFIELAPPQKPEVIFTNPAVDPYTSPVNSMMITANVLHVNSSADIQVTFNGIPVNNFSYNPVTDQFAHQVNLIQGANVMVIGAVNNAGMDSKSTTIIYQTPQQTPKPIVTITNPGVNPYSTGNTSVNLTATILNIIGASQIYAELNGVQTTNFVYSTTTKVFSMNVPLINGINTVIIKASNTAGSDTKSQTIKYTAQLPKPVVTITLPTSNPSSTTNPSGSLNATVLNVNNNAEIAVTLNGNPYMNFIYNMTTKILTMSPVLMPGANNITITASNAGGSDTKSQIINLNSQPVPVLPVVTITNPTSNPFASKDCKLNVTATITGVQSQNNISVTMNGSPFTNFSWNASTQILQITTTQNIGNSFTFVITASNQYGADTKSVTINCPTTQTPPTPTPPIVTITTPASGPVNITGVCMVNIVATVQNVSSANEITVLRNNTPYSNYLWNPVLKTVSINTPMQSAGSYTFTIKATTTAGTDSKSITYNCQDAPPPPPPSNPPVITMITNPLMVLSNTGTNCDINTIAQITNITSQTQLSVTYNGNPFSNFSWNATLMEMTINKQYYNPGANSFVITATNPGGTATKTVSFICPTVTPPPPPPPPPANPPTITIISPNQPVVNYQGNNCNVNVVAKVTGTTSQNQISITYNGSPFTNWTWNANSEHVNFNLQNVTVASNVFVITATTPAGTASVTQTFNCQSAPPPPPPPPAEAPTITIISPNQSTVTYNGNNCNLNVVAKITGITTQNQINITWNGAPFTNYTWNSNSQHVNWNMQHVSPSSNVFVISATTPAGTASVTQTFICNTNSPNNPPANKPSIILTNPTVDPYTSATPTVTVTAKIEGISSVSDVIVRLNNQVQTGAIYNAATKEMSITLTLAEGSNAVQIRASNGQGPTIKNFTVIKGTGNKTGDGDKPKEKDGNKPGGTIPKPKTGIIKKDGQS